MPGLGQGHNQKKDTHTLDFDVTPLLGLKQLTPLIPLRQDFLAKNVPSLCSRTSIMTAQRNFHLGNSPIMLGPTQANPGIIFA